MMAFVWAVALLGAAVGAFQLFDTLAHATSAPQQAAGAALALGIAVVPYVAARGIDAIATWIWRHSLLEAVKALKPKAEKAD